MKWEMEVEEVEAVLEKIWDLHDKFSDAIHSISRTHFTKSLKNPDNFKNSRTNGNGNGNGNGFVFVKDFDKDSAIAEAKSLNSIRCALENLEDQLEFFHTVQIQQRAERDAALARLEQSRIIVALRLAEHHGKRYKVIDEAMDFVGDVRDTSCFVGPELLSNPHKGSPMGSSSNQRPNLLVRFLLAGFDSAKRTLQLDKMGGILGNAALFALSMVALLHIHQVTCKDNDMLEMSSKHERTDKKLTGQTVHLEVRMGRG